MGLFGKKYKEVEREIERTLRYMARSQREIVEGLTETYAKFLERISTSDITTLTDEQIQRLYRMKDLLSNLRRRELTYLERIMEMLED